MGQDDYPLADLQLQRVEPAERVVYVVGERSTRRKTAPLVEPMRRGEVIARTGLDTQSTELSRTTGAIKMNLKSLWHILAPHSKRGPTWYLCGDPQREQCHETWITVVGLLISFQNYRTFYAMPTEANPLKGLPLFGKLYLYSSSIAAVRICG